MEVNVIGLGKVAATLLRQLVAARFVTKLSALNSNISSTQDAVNFVGLGKPLSNISDFDSAKLWIIGTTDTVIPGVAKEIYNSGKLRPQDVVIHLSGFLSSTDLRSCLSGDVSVGSFHPLQSFPRRYDSLLELGDFPFVAEGDAQALSLMENLAQKMSRRLVKISESNKKLYHAATVMICNYLNTVVHAGLSAYKHCGIEGAQALALVEPIIQRTMKNILEQGPRKSLTGPIVRGDEAVVQAEISALQEVDPVLARLYSDLAVYTRQMIDEES